MAQDGERQSIKPVASRTALVWLAAITGVGAVLRLAALDVAPPGLHYDEAVYGLQAMDILHGARPVYFAAYTGREPLYMYLLAAVFRLLGVGTVQLRLTSGLIGIATIPLVYWFAATAFSRRIGLLAAAFTALSYWHLTVSRNGYPNILIPPLECLSMVCLLKGYRERRWPMMALGGAVMGLALYTYLAARFFPITVALFFLHAMVADRKRFWPNWWRVAFAALACILVFAPLGVYFLRHPEHFVERANQVLVWSQLEPSQIPGAVLANLLDTLGGLFVKGDPRPHFNLPGKPILSPVSAALFLVGLGMCLWRWRRIERALLPIWLVGMCLPAILTDDLMPQGQRMFGIVPAIYAIPALGVDAGWRWLNARWAGRGRIVATGLLTTLVVFEATLTGVTYFGAWSKSAETFYAFHGDHVLLGERASQELADGHDVVIHTHELKHPAIVMEHPELLDVDWVSGGHVLVIPNRQDTRYLVAPEWLENHGKIRRRMAELIDVVDTLNDPEGGIAVTVGRVADETLAAHLAAPAVASFVDSVEVIDCEVPKGIARDDKLSVLVQWRVKLGDQPGVLATHLIDEQGVCWSQYRKMGYFAEYWQPGDTVYQVFEMALPEGIPAGRYAVELVMERDGGGLLPVIRDGELSGVSALLGHVELEPEGACICPASDDAIASTQGVSLLAHDPLPETIHLGGDALLWLTWQATGSTRADQVVAFALRDAKGKVAASCVYDICSCYPTSQWHEGEVVRWAYRLPVDELSAGVYALVAVLEEGDPIGLGTITIAGEPRLFEMPAVCQAHSAVLGGEIRLAGYDLGDDLTVTLIWQAAATPDANLKVFVHLVGEDGRIIAQHDAVPANWTRPTHGWLANEYVIDEHALQVPEGTASQSARVYVGIYDAVSLRRLPVTGPGATEDGRLLLVEIDLAP